MCITMEKIASRCLEINKKDFKLILFGTGADFHEFIGEMRFLFSLCKIERKFEDCIEAIIDNDVNKQNKIILGMQVQSSAFLNSIGGDSFIIVTSSSYYREIDIQLKKMGLEEYKHYLLGDLYIPSVLEYWGIYSASCVVSRY